MGSVDRGARALVVFARAPVAGRVKTRLAAVLGDEEALAIYRTLGTRVMRGVARLADCAIVIACTPDHEGELVREWLGDRWRFEEQGEGDLGARMLSAIERRLTDGAERVVVIGTDCPEVDATVIGRAFEALDDADAVIGPASDGGYYLIGVRRSLPVLFQDVPWSSETTLSTTLERAEASGILVALLGELRDIDTAADWQAWCATERSVRTEGAEPTARDAGWQE